VKRKKSKPLGFIIFQLYNFLSRKAGHPLGQSRLWRDNFITFLLYNFLLFNSLTGCTYEFLLRSKTIFYYYEQESPNTASGNKKSAFVQGVRSEHYVFTIPAKTSYRVYGMF
jgi:hypothetical protein